MGGMGGMGGGGCIDKGIAGGGIGGMLGGGGGYLDGCAVKVGVKGGCDFPEGGVGGGGRLNEEAAGAGADADEEGGSDGGGGPVVAPWVVETFIGAGPFPSPIRYLNCLIA